MLQNVLVLTGVNSERFKELGSGDGSLPRLPECYPYYGALRERGVEVTVRSCGKVAQDRKGLRVLGRWSPQLSVLLALRDFSKYDAVVTWGSLGPLLAMLSKSLNRQNRKLVTVSFANYSGMHRNLLKIARQTVYQRGLPLCGKVIFMTRRQAGEAVNNIGCVPARVAYLPAGVDTSFFAPWPAYADASVRAELRGLETQRYVVVAGDQLREEHQIIRVLGGSHIGLVRLTQNKDTERFWKGWAQDNPASFPVLCIAHLDWREVRYVYQHAMCLLNLVGSSWQPAGWTVMTEAMACGLPVIVNRGLTTEEMKLYLSRGEALPFIEVERLDPVEARGALEDLIDSREVIQEMVHRARLFVEKHFDIEQTGKLAVQILSKVVEDSPRLV
ncbi:MAG: glycosyltransferase [Candidatus Binatia bacterium]